jgi:hypothetical protein
MKKVLPVIAGASLLLGGCGAESENYTSIPEIVEYIEENEITDSRAYGIGVGIVTTCVKSAGDSELVLPEGIEAVDQENVDVGEYNDGLAEGERLVEFNEPNVCEFLNAPLG